MTAKRRQIPSLRSATVPPRLDHRRPPPPSPSSRDEIMPAGSRRDQAAPRTRRRWQDGRVATHWTAVIPVKRLSAAKSRLRGAVPDAHHQDLTLAMMRDTAAAVLATPGVT